MSPASDANLAAARRTEWKTHWPLVLASTVGFAFYSIIVNAIGLFLDPMSKEFGWSRTQIMAGLSLLSISGIILSPFVGALIDRFGARRIALPGLVLTALAIASFGLANGSMLQWTLMWVVTSLVLLMIKTTVWTTAVSSTFDAARSLAIAITIAGTAFAQAVVPPLTQWLISGFGWRSAWVSLGLGWGAVALILAVFFLYDAKDRSRIARNRGREAQGADTGVELAGLSLGEAFRSPPLIRIGIATFIVMLMGVGISVNQVPIIVESGISRDRAAIFASFFGIAGIIGKIVTGWLMDRYNASVVGGLTLALSAFAVLLLLEQLASPALIVTGLVVIGYASGTKLQICAYLTSIYGGIRNYGKIFGIMSSLIAIGGGFGPASAAAVYDATGSYSLFIYAAVALTLFASLMLFTLGPPPKAVLVKPA